MVCTILLVVAFRSSSSLAAAYGIAVTTTMVITTFLLYFVARYLWGWSVLKASLVMALFHGAGSCLLRREYHQDLRMAVGFR